MNFEYLDEFVHLARSLSFRRTAEHFFVSRSVISRHMAALEESLGAPVTNSCASATCVTARDPSSYGS